MAKWNIMEFHDVEYFCFFKKDSIFAILAKSSRAVAVLLASLLPQGQHCTTHWGKPTHKTLITNHLLKQVAKVSEPKPGN